MDYHSKTARIFAHRIEKRASVIDKHASTLFYKNAEKIFTGIAEKP